MPTGADSSEIKLAFASGSQDLIDQFVEEVEKMAGLDLPVYLVSEFKPEVACHWIPWHPFEAFETNLARIRWHIGPHRIRFNCILVQPRQPYWKMRWAGIRIAPTKVYFFNENYGYFPMHLRGLPQMIRHGLWRTRNFLVSQTRIEGPLFTYWWRLKNPSSFERPLYAWLASRRKALETKPLRSEKAPELEPGITVVIPSRQGRHLLEQLLPQIRAQQGVQRVIVVDNGSSDDTASLADDFVDVMVERLPMSFASAVNAGIRATRTTHVCLLNNDMVLEDGFFPALQRAFDLFPNLFCATAQIFFPEGKRREETGKAAWKPVSPRDFPVRCLPPAAGENYTPVLYGSGGCSLYDTRKLLAIGCLKEAFRPAYVEDLDVGWRGWQQGWPTVFVADARVIHHHRSTTARFIAASSIELAIEHNYLRWIQSSVATPTVFDRLWQAAVMRANLLAAVPEPAPIAMYTLRFAAFEKPYFAWDRPAQPLFPEDRILALGGGDLACFPGQAAHDKPRILIATSYLPYPLSHGGAVRMFNLMREAAKHYSLVLLSFVDEFLQPEPELAELCVEVVEVLRQGTHYRLATPRPKAVEEFDSDAFRAALHWVKERWQPQIAQLEFTQMAQYAGQCAPAKTILVEHDITVDLYEQLLAEKDEFDLRLEKDRWKVFESAAWQEVDCVAVMSDQDRKTVSGAKRVEVIENGVDLDRFRPTAQAPEPGRILFIGSFAHLPNVLALDWFVSEVWPRLYGSKLHVIAGRHPDYYLNFYQERVSLDLNAVGIEVEAFVSDVRPAYACAEIVIAPLLASAGTNIKVLEAMACGKAVVATTGGVNGLQLVAGEDYLAGQTGEAFAEAIRSLQRDAVLRTKIETQARQSVEARYGWEAIGAKQRKIYESLRAKA
ncbi:glycosyltransferase [Bryobacter aggregatus]|uniref:glycosyltransferase n=1 Tax=Bryobacter aggregatus TaxID=360054 RepID=UPI0004E2552A|nr:glycosyltransferase [Bryobacter aggregatus]